MLAIFTALDYFSAMQSFQFPGQTNFYRGKVRDVYSIGDNLLVMVASNRISAFDVILPPPIPYKGQVLTQIAAYMLNACSSVCPNWLLDTPVPVVSIGRRCAPLPVEVVIRGHLAGHAWRTYQSGQRMLCGAIMPEGMKENDAFPVPLITPSTKAAVGHDEDISAEDILARGLVAEKDWEIITGYAHALFRKGQEMARDKNLILADTKYEFGKIGNEIILMDEIHTPDSSRYFFADGFEERQLQGIRQPQLSKEFVREWLIENDFMGKEGQTVPEMSPKWIETISKKYIELYEKLTGLSFQPWEWNDEELIEKTIASIKKHI
jgi:phosphoribosylaminoimidazole-succinocarboxamide synthase